MRHGPWMWLMMLALVGLAGGCVGDAPPAVREVATWENPQPIYGSPQRVIVLAKLADDAERRRLEDETVAYLRRRGVDAVAAYDTLGDAELGSEQAFNNAIRKQRVDALLRYRAGDRRNEVRDEAAENLASGVQVAVGFFSFFVGPDAPLRPPPPPVEGKAHLQVPEEPAPGSQRGQVTADYFRRDRNEPQWSGLYDVDLTRTDDEVRFEVIEFVVDGLRREGML